MSGEVFRLNNAEVEALTRRLMARLVADWDRHVGWEDVPYLVDIDWRAVSEAMQQFARQALDMADDMDRAENIDSRYLYERATDPAPAGTGEGR